MRALIVCDPFQLVVGPLDCGRFEGASEDGSLGLVVDATVEDGVELAGSASLRWTRRQRDPLFQLLDPALFRASLPVRIQYHAYP